LKKGGRPEKSERKKGGETLWSSGEKKVGREEKKKKRGDAASWR